jgi:hypothetical protein
MDPSQNDLQKRQISYLMRFAIGEGLALLTFLAWWFFDSEQKMETLMIGIVAITFIASSLFLVPKMIAFSAEKKRQQERDK